VQMRKRYRFEGLAYTYNEPSIFIEFAHDIGVQARKARLINIFVSNGYDTPGTVGLMRDFLDGITVDFKGSGETSFVRKYIGIANAAPIFQTLLAIRGKTKVHIEITNLIVPRLETTWGLSLRRRPILLSASAKVSMSEPRKHRKKRTKPRVFQMTLGL